MKSFHVSGRERWFDWECLRDEADVSSHLFVLIKPAWRRKTLFKDSCASEPPRCEMSDLYLLMVINPTSGRERRPIFRSV